MTGRTKRLLSVVVVLAMATKLLLPHLVPQPPTLWVLSIGQGESVLYRDTSGKLLLFDGGPDDTVLSELGRVLAPWQHTIDTLVLSHPHADHLRGLISVLDRYTVHEVWASGAGATGNDVLRWNELLHTKKPTLHYVKAGDKLKVGDTHVLVLHPITSAVGTTPKQTHNATVVLQLRARNHSILLTGDLEERHETAIIDWCKPPSCSLKSEVLQIPHHGSASGLAPSFLAAIKPEIAFISVGRNNQFKHPRDVILQRLKEAQVPYHRTDTQGGLRIRFPPGRIEYGTYGSVPR